MTVTVNGREQAASPGDTVESLLERLGLAAQYALVERNGEPVERERYGETALADGDTLPLAGVPVVIKDNIATLGSPTTCGSRILSGYHSPYEATVVRRLREAGVVRHVVEHRVDEHDAVAGLHVRGERLRRRARAVRRARCQYQCDDEANSG